MHKKKKVKRPSLAKRLRDLEIRVANLELPATCSINGSPPVPIQFKWKVLHRRRRLA